MMALRVVLTPEARRELSALPTSEQAALDHALKKLEAVGIQLGAPHSSSIVGIGATLRELRPRAGRSPWRAFYRRIGSVLVVGAIGPEATVDPQGFRRAVNLAIERLDAIQRQYEQEGTS
jgi:hypothetical protein